MSFATGILAGSLLAVSLYRRRLYSSFVAWWDIEGLLLWLIGMFMLSCAPFVAVL
jgi:hypothetical protein